jgi:3-deoxy-manno-octulosonate cytidylyltransferase (CMP-KDO synthetase)
MRVIGVIPARYQSSRFPGKPLTPILGKPMIQYVYERSSEARRVDEVWVATDDQRICEAVESFGAKVMLTSPAHESGTERVAEAARKIPADPADIVINIQGDEPLIRPEAIDLLAGAMAEDRKIPMATLKRRISRKQDIDNPNCVKVVTSREGFALYFSRSPIPFDRDGHNGHESPFFVYQHIGIYAYRTDFLLQIPALPPSILEQTERLEQLRILENGYRIKVVETDYESYGVDTPEDVLRIESMLESNQCRQPAGE